jgi:hypothetical protein
VHREDGMFVNTLVGPPDFKGCTEQFRDLYEASRRYVMSDVLRLVTVHSL